jgi:hypothetical protein
MSPATAATSHHGDRDPARLWSGVNEDPELPVGVVTWVLIHSHTLRTGPGCLAPACMGGDRLDTPTPPIVPGVPRYTD